MCPPTLAAGPEYQATADGIAAHLFFDPNIADNIPGALATLNQSSIAVRCGGHCSPLPALLTPFCPWPCLPGCAGLCVPAAVFTPAHRAFWPAPQTGTLYASALSQLGLVYGTTERGRDFYSLYLEPAFVSTEWYNATLLNLVNDTAAEGAGAAAVCWDPECTAGPAAAQPLAPGAAQPKCAARACSLLGKHFGGGAQPGIQPQHLVLQ